MDIGFLHLHVTVVTVFLIFLIFKTILLTINKKELLAKVRNKTKVVESVLGALILITGIFILVKYADIRSYHLGKIILMMLAIPLGIIGLKKEKKLFAWASVLVFVYIYGVAETKSLTFKPKYDFEVATVNVKIDEALADDDTVKEVLENRNEQLAQNGKIIYLQLCVQCHGDDGDKGLFKAPELSASRLAPEDRRAVIKNGKGNMPHFRYLKTEELEAVALYLEKLRK